jgi:hypothetical protein
MSEMASSTALVSAHHINTPFQESVKALLPIVLVDLPVPFGESFQFGEELPQLD